MPRLVWDAVGTRTYEAGIDRGVLYLPDATGVPWNGLTAVNESVDGGEVTSYFIDGIKYLDSVAGVNYKATIEAYTYPDEFEACMGVNEVQEGLFATGQSHIPFSFSYRTMVGNDTDGIDHGYKIHIVTNATVAPLSKEAKTLRDSTDLDPFSWDVVAVPIEVPGMKPTAHLVIDSRRTDPTVLSAIEHILYGDAELQAHIPSILNLMNVITSDGGITVTSNNDGTWFAIVPDEFLTRLDDHTWQVTEANAVFLDDHTYTLDDST